MKSKLQAIKKWQQGEFISPRALRIAPTESCNLKCIFCSRTVTNSFTNFELSDETWIKIIREAYELGIPFIDIAGGGEPFYKFNTTMKIIKEIIKLNLDGSVTTNGTLLVESTIRYLVKNNWKNITISIDAPYEKIHNKLRGCKACFIKSVNTIKLINKWKSRKSNLNKNFPHITINMVIMKHNFTYIEEMIRMAFRIKVNSVAFISLTSHDTETEKWKLNKKESAKFNECAKRANRLAIKYKIKTNLDEFSDYEIISKTNKMRDILLSTNEINGEIPCYEPWVSLVIHPDGNVDPCQHNCHASQIGNRSLRDVWIKDRHLNKIRKSILKNKLFPQCDLCCSRYVAENKLKS